MKTKMKEEIKDYLYYFFSGCKKVEVGEKDDDYISYAEIKKIQSHLASFTLEDRINKLGLRPDRADVILPAADIYLAIINSHKQIVKE